MNIKKTGVEHKSYVVVSQSKLLVIMNILKIQAT